MTNMTSYSSHDPARGSGHNALKKSRIGSSLVGSGQEMLRDVTRRNGPSQEVFPIARGGSTHVEKILAKHIHTESK